MLTDDERRQGAQLLFDAERQRKAIPQLSKTFPGIEIVDAYRIQDLWAEIENGSRRRRRRSQDRPDLARHADGLEDDGARLRPHLRSTPSTTTALRFPLVASSSRVSKSNWLSLWAKTSKGRAGAFMT